ncbi:MAG TPA: hypothetical protein VLB90_11825 [Pseudomonadales bacterium]|nr:hypothetical protein [Pseudomonadales bacterium]
MSDEKLKKELIQMRMELHRQEMRHEALLVMQPLQQIKKIRHGWQRAKPWVSLAGLVTPVLIATLRQKTAKKDLKND